MAFPTSPTNGDIYVKDGVSYQYTAASNTWDIITDPDKIASNIKSGVEIDGITGTYTGSASLGSEQTINDGVSSYIRYRKYGDFYIVHGIQFVSSPPLEHFIGGSSEVNAQTSADRIASLIGVTITSYDIQEMDRSVSTALYYWTGSAWTNANGADYVLYGFIAT